MKLYVYEKQENYESCLIVVLANDVEEARKMITRDMGYPYEYPNNMPIEAKELSSYGYEIDKPIIFSMSHSG